MMLTKREYIGGLLLWYLRPILAGVLFVRAATATAFEMEFVPDTPLQVAWLLRTFFIAMFLVLAYILPTTLSEERYGTKAHTTRFLAWLFAHKRMKQLRRGYTPAPKVSTERYLSNLAKGLTASQNAERIKRQSIGESLTETETTAYLSVMSADFWTRFNSVSEAERKQHKYQVVRQ